AGAWCGGGGGGGAAVAGGGRSGRRPLPPAGRGARGGGASELEAVAAGDELVVGPAAGLAVERRVGVGARAGSRTAPLLLRTGSARALSRRRLRIRPLSRSGGAAIVGRGHRRGMVLSLRRSRALLARVRRDRLAALPVLLGAERLLQPVLDRRRGSGERASGALLAFARCPTVLVLAAGPLGAGRHQQPVGTVVRPAGRDEVDAAVADDGVRRGWSERRRQHDDHGERAERRDGGCEDTDRHDIGHHLLRAPRRHGLEILPYQE